MWYNHLNEYLLEKEFENNEIFPCIFIKKTISRFVIVIVQVDDLYLIGTYEELTKTATYLKDEFEIKRSWKNKILSWITNWWYFNWKIYPSIDIYKKDLEALLHGQCSSFKYTYGYSITWCE